ncbi:outer membrane protein assembly factor BamC [Anaerobiospirillum thomasii]|uniref:Lipoprotein n=1 Tax=Anaerobiospirillum thomasii TaxID=179995 RepID=A0A2X0VMP8_9GAMM|nr:outer membrane protein assembly factor BamC [Anaerobiospirillum thomasii]SPT70778.1 lipoprotein [Anaerobiospirillum thomasii]
MYKYKFSASALAVFTTMTLSSCGAVGEYYQYFSGELDTSLREPTGYYEHEIVKDAPDQLVVPAGLDAPAADNSLNIPDVAVSYGPTGEDMDIRAPIVPIRSEMGVDSQWANNEAIVWLRPDGPHAIHSEQQAWDLLGKVLMTMGVRPGQVTSGAYELTTVAADFNEYGKPYTGLDSESYGYRYRQVYRIRIGRSADNSIGIATSLIGSMTMLSSGKSMDNILSPIEQQRFATGFANEIIHTIDTVNTALISIPDEVSVILGRDSNDQDCFIINAPYESVWEVIRQVLPQYSFVIKEYSISNSTICVEYDEEDYEFFAEKGVDAFNLESGEYIIRIAVEGDKSIVTFYDGDDKPLKTTVISALYPGMSKALVKGFENYSKFDMSSFM